MMGEVGHNTNLAAEYHVLSMRYRMGADAYLTLGNKKSIDIVVHKGSGPLTVDVKGLLGESNFPIDNWKLCDKSHFLVFVSFKCRINDPQCVPECYIVPSLELEAHHAELDGKSIIYRNPKGTRRVVQLGLLRRLKSKYLDRWDYFTAESDSKEKAFSNNGEGIAGS